MSTATERFPIDRFYIWMGLMAIIGLSIIVSSVASILAGSGGFWNWMMIVGGGALLVMAGWEARQRNPTEFSKSDYWFVFLALAALLSVVGSALTLLSFL
ncbi:hypothetical protein [Halococcus hamelinensis]|uniref:Uncharacterized protein n=1 Tax=Halococcus hamelinensis 100A6 TaxID=1132509 RepID=M0MBN4_9EURY|nr:hypothetical protein [Halococcus hamelinensis]EMA42029.1 hypothetical protein C447_00525 [Halococcus hamelinensis 100A6]